MRTLANVIRVGRPVRTLEADLIARIGSASISVDVKDLLRIWGALDSAALHLLNRDLSNAALHLESIRRSPLTNRLIDARERLENILADSIPKEIPIPTQPEGSSEENQGE